MSEDNNSFNNNNYSNFFDDFNILDDHIPSELIINNDGFDLDNNNLDNNIPDANNINNNLNDNDINNNHIPNENNLNNNNNVNNGNIPQNVMPAIQQYMDNNNADDFYRLATDGVKAAIIQQHGKSIDVDTALMYFDHFFNHCNEEDKHNGKLPMVLRYIFELLPPVDNLGYTNPNTARRVFMNAFASRPYYYQLEPSDIRKPFYPMAVFARIWMNTPPANHNIQPGGNNNNQNNNILQNNNLNILQNNNLPQQQANHNIPLEENNNNQNNNPQPQPQTQMQTQQNNNINNKDKDIMNNSTLQKKRGRGRGG